MDASNEDTYVENLSGKKLTQIPSDSFKKSLKSIDLSCNSIRKIQQNDFKNCPMVKQLKLYSNKIIKINGLNNLTKLEELQLQFNYLFSIGKTLADLKNLKTLRIDSNRIQSILTQEVCVLSNLSFLDVSSNLLHNIDFVKVLTNLQQLHCTHNQLTNISNLKLKHLEEIDLSFNAIETISGMKMLPKLKILKLQNNNLSTLTNAGSVKSLQELHLDDNNICSIKNITEQFPNLEILHISANAIAELKQLEELLTISDTLQELSIYNNPIISNVEEKKNIAKILSDLDLSVIDSISQKPAKRSTTPSLMRPMSANQGVSTRCIEQQLKTTDILMEDFIDRIKSQFTVLNAVLAELPDEKSIEESRSISRLRELNNCSVLSEARPKSKCNSRTRIEEAKAFADMNFDQRM